MAGLGPKGRLFSGINAYLAGLDMFEPIPAAHKSQEQARLIEQKMEILQKRIGDRERVSHLSRL